jgi:hypothetical protein
LSTLWTEAQELANESLNVAQAKRGMRSGPRRRSCGWNCRPRSRPRGRSSRR